MTTDHTLSAIYNQKLIEEVTRGIRESTDELSLRVGLKHKLDLLDKIVADPANATTDGSPAWRPTPNAQGLNTDYIFLKLTFWKD